MVLKPSLDSWTIVSLVDNTGNELLYLNRTEVVLKLHPTTPPTTIQFHHINTNTWQKHQNLAPRPLCPLNLKLDMSSTAAVRFCPLKHPIRLLQAQADLPVPTVCSLPPEVYLVLQPLFHLSRQLREDNRLMSAFLHDSTASLVAQ